MTPRQTSGAHMDLHTHGGQGGRVGYFSQLFTSGNQSCFPRQTLLPVGQGNPVKMANDHELASELRIAFLDISKNSGSRGGLRLYPSEVLGEALSAS